MSPQHSQHTAALLSSCLDNQHVNLTALNDVVLPAGAHDWLKVC